MTGLSSGKRRTAAARDGADIDVDTPLAQLTTGQEQMVQNRRGGWGERPNHHLSTSQQARCRLMKANTC